MSIWTEQRVSLLVNGDKITGGTCFLMKFKLGEAGFKVFMPMVMELILFVKLMKTLTYTIPIEDCTKDGGEEFFTEMHCVLSSNSCRIQL